MRKVPFVLLWVSVAHPGFRFSLNPFSQIENAEKNRRDFWDGVSSVFNTGKHNKSSDSYDDDSASPDGPRKQRPGSENFKSLAGRPPQGFIDLRDYLLHPEKYKKAHVRPFKGILLYGPPGTGKTSLVRALAKETGCELIATSGSEFGAILKGVGMLQIKRLFAQAREISEETGRPTIIFFDDFDALGNRNDYRADPQTIGELLNQLDGYNENDSFIVVAATNNPEQIDPGLKRRGRFDKIIEIGLPDGENRLAIIMFYLEQHAYDKNIDLNYFAQQTQNFTPADLRVFVEATCMNALRANHAVISHEDMLEALQEVMVSINLGSNEKHKLKNLNLDPDQPRGFEHLAGEINQEIMDLVMQLRYPERYVKLGIERPRGFLFVGPPGTGKTSLARAIAEETDCDFINVSASEFIEMYVGVGAQRVRELFGEARKRAQQNTQKTTIIFIDDLDAIGRRSAAVGDSETQRTLVELLNQMDGFTKEENIVVIAATNNPIGIDPALKRPGRFEVIIEVPLPDAHKRLEILGFYCKNRPVDLNIDFQEYAVHMQGFTPADIRMFVNQAAKYALRDNVEIITDDHFDRAFTFMLRRRELVEEEYLEPRVHR